MSSTKAIYLIIKLASPCHNVIGVKFLLAPHHFDVKKTGMKCEILEKGYLPVFAFNAGRHRPLWVVLQSNLLHPVMLVYIHCAPPA